MSHPNEWDEVLRELDDAKARAERAEAELAKLQADFDEMAACHHVCTDHLEPLLDEALEMLVSWGEYNWAYNHPKVLDGTRTATWHYLNRPVIAKRRERESEQA